MKIVKLMLSVAVSIAFVFSAYSSARDIESVYKQCGIGGHLFGKSSPTLAFISNVTWDLGTTAATSDATDACIDPPATAALYIYEAYEILEQEISQGRGQYFESLATLLSCESSGLDAVLAGVRADFSQKVGKEGFSGKTRMEKAQALYEIVTPRLSTSKAAACNLS